MKVGQSTQNSQGTCPMVGAASPEDGKSMSKCAKSHLEPPAIDDAPSWVGQGWKDPCLSSSPEKLNPGPICPKLTGDLPLTKDHLP